MTSTKSEAHTGYTSMGSMNMSSPLVLRDWNEAFKLSTPVRSSPTRTPSKTNWKLGAPQVCIVYTFTEFQAQFQLILCKEKINVSPLFCSGLLRHEPLPPRGHLVYLRGVCSKVPKLPSLSFLLRRRQHAAVIITRVINRSLTIAGAALASTPAQSGQRYLPHAKSKTNGLIAPSLAKLPNALDAEYWLNKIKVQEDLGNYQVTYVMDIGAA